MDEGIDLGWLEGKMKLCGAGADVRSFLDLQVEPALARGENYASRMLRLRIRAVLVNGDEATRSVVLKRMIDVPDPRTDFAVSLYQLFNSEYQIYSTVLPHIESALKGNTKDESKFWPDCYAFIPNRDIYFQDLNEFGYKVGDRKKGLDLEHSELMLRALGRFHAASMVVVERGRVDVAGMRPYFMSVNDDSLRRSLSPSFRLMSRVVRSDWGPQWKGLADKLDNLPGMIFDLMSRSYQPEPSRINVINHGDFWVSNCMFRYDSHNKPASVRLVDFQVCHYNSYAWDLVYFLNTSVDSDLKASYLTRLLQVYCSSFGETLADLGSPLSGPTPAHARSELARLAGAALTAAVCVRPVIMCPSEENVLKTDEIMSEGNGADLKKLHLFRNPLLTKILKVDLKEALSHIDL